MKNFIFSILLLLTAIKAINCFSCNYGIEKYTKISTEISEYTCKIWESSDTKSQILGSHLSSKNNLNVKVLLKDSGVNLYQFSSIFCSVFNNLEAIDLSEDYIELISANSLENCSELKQLSFSNNKIRNIDPNSLSKNSKLIYISFANNKLATLPEDLFFNQHNLDVLDLSYNYIKKLPANIFNSLSKLRQLNLLNNKLKEINSNLFENLQSLVTLSLSFNKLSELPKNIFQSLTNLEKLWISSNQLSELSSNSFGNNIKLSLLDLSDNRISAIDSRVFDKLKSIEVLNMRDNICNQGYHEGRSKIVESLKPCFELYIPEIESTFTQSNLPKNCGKPATGRQNIVGGTVLQPGVIRWNAALLQANGEFFCSGTLLTSTRIVTAAHCILQKGQRTPLYPRDIIVLLGAYDLDKKVEVGRFSPVVSNIIIHPEWNQNVERFDADVAVLILSNEVQFTEHIQPACMIDRESVVSSLTNGFVAGYGKSENVSKIHENIPKVVYSPIQDNEDCFLKFKELTELSSKRTFCAGNANGEGVCTGDSGGALFIIHENTFYLRGIVSSSLFQFGESCDVNTFAVFTDVLKFSDWILSAGS